MESVEGRLSELEEMLKELMAGMLMLQKSNNEMSKNIESLYEITKENVRSIEELRKSVEELNKSMEQSQKEHEKIWQSIRENAEKAEKEHEKIWQSIRENAEKSSKENEKILQRIDKMEKNHEKEIKRFNKEWGALSNKLGTIVEDIIFPATRPVLESYFKCKITYISTNIEKVKGKLEGEFDIVATSDKCKTVFLIEVKSSPRIDYVNEFKEKKLKLFRELFEEYKDYKLIPIFASLRIKSDILKYLTKQNIYAMAFREWEYMDLLNFKQVYKRLKDT